MAGSISDGLKITIQISGPICSGKSTIALAIQTMLLSHGINAEMVTPIEKEMHNDYRFDRINNPKKYFEVLRGKNLTVNIETVQTPREG